MAGNVLDGKFFRNYILDVQTQSGSILTIKPPFTIEFDITRTVLSSANVSQIRIYNLSQKNRDQLRFDVTNYGKFREVHLRAGYQSNMPTVFRGNIRQAWSNREGVNFITQLESFDGGHAYANALTNRQFPSGTPQRDVLSSLVGDLGQFGILPGVIGNAYVNSLSRGNSYNGSTTELLRELSGGGFFIDNTRANCLADNEVFRGAIPLLNAQSGLLGTPMREQFYVDFEMLFEPRLAIGQQVQLQSIGDASFNGFYKVVIVKHRGTISEAVCGDAITHVRLIPGTSALTPVGPS